MADGNFGFVKNLNADIYEKLYDAERRSRTDFRSSGHDTREALEKIIGSIIEHYRLGRIITKGLELSKKIEMLRDEYNGSIVKTPFSIFIMNQIFTAHIYTLPYAASSSICSNAG